MKILCNSCENTFEVNPSTAGKVKYSKCKSVFRVEYFLKSPCPHCNTPLKVITDEKKNHIGYPLEKTERRETKTEIDAAQIKAVRREPTKKIIQEDTEGKTIVNINERLRKKLETRLENSQRFSVKQTFIAKSKIDAKSKKIATTRKSNSKKKIKIPNLGKLANHASQPKVYLTFFTLLALFLTATMMKSIFKSDDTLTLSATNQPVVENGVEEYEPQGDEPQGGPAYLSDDKKAGLEDETIKKINSNLQVLKLPPLKQVTSTFGVRLDPFTRKLAFHAGIDFKEDMGSKIEAAMDGTVKYAGPKSSYGFAVVIRHNNGYETLYGHLSKVLVQAGQRVKQKDIIALAGSTGRSTGAHLHFELIKNGKKIDPLQADLLSLSKN